MKNIILILVLVIIFIACNKDEAKNLPSAHDPCDNISGLCIEQEHQHIAIY